MDSKVRTTLHVSITDSGFEGVNEIKLPGSVGLMRGDYDGHKGLVVILILGFM